MKRWIFAIVLAISGIAHAQGPSFYKQQFNYPEASLVSANVTNAAYRPTLTQTGSGTVAMQVNGVSTNNLRRNVVRMGGNAGNGYSITYNMLHKNVGDECYTDGSTETTYNVASIAIRHQFMIPTPTTPIATGDYYNVLDILGPSNVEIARLRVKKTAGGYELVLRRRKADTTQTEDILISYYTINAWTHVYFTYNAGQSLSVETSDDRSAWTERLSTTDVDNQNFAKWDIRGITTGSTGVGAYVDHAETRIDASADRSTWVKGEYDNFWACGPSYVSDSKVVWNLPIPNNLITNGSHVRVHYSTNELDIINNTGGSYTSWGALTTSPNNWVPASELASTSLSSGTKYYYAVEIGNGSTPLLRQNVSDMGTPYVWTAPAASGDGGKRAMLVFSCWDNSPILSRNLAVETLIPKLDALDCPFVIVCLGDQIYETGLTYHFSSNINGPDDALEHRAYWLEAKWNYWRAMLLRRGAILSHLDDHETFNNVLAADVSSATTMANVHIARGLQPAYASSTEQAQDVISRGIALWEDLGGGHAMTANVYETNQYYGQFVFGDSRIIFLDGRYNSFDASSAYLGATQVSWLEDRIDETGYKYTFITVNSTSQAISTRATDSWGFANPTERNAVMEYIEANGTGTYTLLVGDVHSGGHVNVQIKGNAGAIITPKLRLRGEVLVSGSAQQVAIHSTGPYDASSRDALISYYPYRDTGYAKPATDPEDSTVYGTFAQTLKTAPALFVWDDTQSTTPMRVVWHDELSDGSVVMRSVIMRKHAIQKPVHRSMGRSVTNRN